MPKIVKVSNGGKAGRTMKSMKESPVTPWIDSFHLPMKAKKEAFIV
jgi:hypothetical protein